MKLIFARIVLIRRGWKCYLVFPICLLKAKPNILILIDEHLNGFIFAQITSKEGFGEVIFQIFFHRSSQRTGTKFFIIALFDKELFGFIGNIEFEFFSPSAWWIPCATQAQQLNACFLWPRV